MLFQVIIRRLQPFLGGRVQDRQERDVTGLLEDLRAGDRSALDQLMPLVHAELHQIAASLLRRERPNHTLQPTALVNEAYLKLVDQHRVEWQNRAHFFAVSARLMRRILVDHARAHRAEKRGGSATRVTLDDVDLPHAARDLDLIALDDALNRLARRDPDASTVVELKFFGGLTTREIAEVVGSSSATIEREWSMAKAWLYRQLEGDDPA